MAKKQKDVAYLFKLLLEKNIIDDENFDKIFQYSSPFINGKSNEKYKSLLSKVISQYNSNEIAPTDDGTHLKEFIESSFIDT